MGAIGRRLDVELVDRGLADSRRAAQRDIRAGLVRVDDRVVDKPSRSVTVEQAISVAGTARPYVSRAGEKLTAALDAIGLDVGGARALDVGASTGGFTDCLLQRGAASVVAVDVGTGQLHERLVADPRVDNRERTDIRHLDPESIDRPITVAVIDVSFISLLLVLAPVAAFVEPGADIVALVKPQFEAGREAVAAGRGVVRDRTIWRRVLRATAEGASDLGLAPERVIASPVPGATGNREFFLHLRPASSSPDDGLRPVAAYARIIADIDDAVARAEAVPT